MRKKKRTTDQQSWADVAKSLEYFIPQLDTYSEEWNTRPLERHWFLWTVDHDGQVTIVKVEESEAKEAGERMVNLSYAAAELGQPCGMGVWSEAYGSMMLTAYSPPNWPNVVNDEGQRKWVVAAWPPESLLGSILRGEVRADIHHS